MTDKSKNRMNLAAVKKVDPYAKDIIDSSAHVAFYTFNSVKNEWDKTDVEGVFFVYRRNAEPYHSIFINNRLNTTSFVEPITPQLEIQSQPPFLLYRNERSRIRGFWFYNNQECDRIGELINSLLRESDTKIKPNTVNTEAIKMKKTNDNIFSMLNKAQNEYYLQHMVKNQVSSRNVQNFFAAAKPTTSSELPNCAPKLSNSISVEQLEQQQRSKTPPGVKTEDMIHVTNANSKTEPRSELETSLLENFSSIHVNTNSPKNQNQGLLPIIKNENIFTQMQRIASNDLSLNIPDATGGIESCTYKPALMPPTMFERVDNSNAVAKKPKPFGVDPLNYTQFVQAFSYMVKHDTGFMQRLHEAYLKSFSDVL